MEPVHGCDVMAKQLYNEVNLVRGKMKKWRTGNTRICIRSKFDRRKIVVNEVWKKEGKIRTLLLKEGHALGRELRGRVRLFI